MAAAATQHRQTFRVHSYDTDPAGRLAPGALCAYLQEAAGRHAHALGVGMEGLLAEGRAWMLHRIRVEVGAWPAAQDEIAVLTWPTRFSGAVAERAFRVTDASGAELARGLSRWAVVDLRARKAVRLTEEIRGLPIGEAPGVELGPTPELPADAPMLGEARLSVGRADLDVVGHANNSRYVEWALEAVPDEWMEAHALRSFEIAFRREARRGDVILARSARLGELRLGHELTASDERGTLATLETRWRSSALPPS